MDYLQEDEYYSPPEHHNNGPYQAAQPGPVDGHPDQIDSADPFNKMPPPTEGLYPSLPELMTACQNHARAHGYACVTSSNNYKRGIAYVRCDRGGQYVNHWKLTPETRVRKNRTRRLVGCDWKARAKRTNEGDWQLTMMNAKHNGHGRSESATQHPSLRQLPRDAMEDARVMFQEKRTPKEVLDVLQHRYNPDVTAQDVYNLKAKIARLDNREAAQNGDFHAPQSPLMMMNGGEDPPTDPRLMEQPPMHQAPMQSAHMHQAPMQQAPMQPMQMQPVEGPIRAGKCQCTCCEH